MYQPIMFAAASLLAIAATPASATKPDPANAPKIDNGQDSAQSSSEKQRYCIVQTLTGSRIPLKECHTRSDWLKMGFDPLQK